MDIQTITIFQKMLFFLLLMLLRSICHQVSNQADEFDLLVIFFFLFSRRLAPLLHIYLIVNIL